MSATNKTHGLFVMQDADCRTRLAADPIVVVAAGVRRGRQLAGSCSRVVPCALANRQEGGRQIGGGMKDSTGGHQHQARSAFSPKTR